MTLRIVRPCDTPSCDREAGCEITDHGEHVAWHCRGCIDVIQDVLANTAEMMRSGTPRWAAVRWARSR